MTLTGFHLIAGVWVAGQESFASATGAKIALGTPADIDAAVQAAEAAFAPYAALSRDARAVFLETIADQIEARGAEITEIATAESGLPAARLEGERGRTTGQLRLFAAHIRKTDFLDARHDPALPDRKPLPRPDIKLLQRPIGPVAVFGALAVLSAIASFSAVSTCEETLIETSSLVSCIQQINTLQYPTPSGKLSLKSL